MPDIFAENQPNNTTAPVQNNTAAQPAVVNPVHLFTTYCKNPRGLSFAEQGSDETIILFLRRDFITNVPWMVATVALGFIPYLVRFIFDSTNFSLFSMATNLSGVVVSFYYLIVFGFAFANMVSWFYNIGLVTNKRGVEINFYDLSAINVATASLPDIIDVSYTQSGFFQSLFDYGDINLQVLASGETFTFQKVPRPTEVAGIISNLIGSQKT
jgi:hypothetical protein